MKKFYKDSYKILFAITKEIFKEKWKYLYHFYSQVY